MNRTPALSMPLLVSLLSAAPILGCATTAPSPQSEPPPQDAQTAPPAPLGDRVIPPLPAWTDRFAKPNEVPPPFFAITRLMERYSLTRAQAVELQNHYRDLTRANASLDPEQAFATALKRVQENQFERPLDVEQLRQAKFIVVFDLDETLWSQYDPARTPVTCADFVMQGAQAAGTPNVKLIPGWQQAFERIRALGGAIVIFSANLDDPTLARLEQWKFHGTPLLQSPEIAGVLTNSHLILQDKAEEPKNNPVREPSKDLRIFNDDPKAKGVSEKVIIVDDNPVRLFNDQLTHARVIKKFEAKHYCASPGDPRVRKAFDDSLAEVVRELEESAQYMNQKGVGFSRAFLPYSWLGQLTVRFLMESGGLDRAQAIDSVRSNPETVDQKF
ncbi:NIF family HAD-type phosphatase [Hyalangium minutum]|uniref:NIF family HAD-type phosphatase n=1 Tax=Hyalangium minutum TaxID=394096 RepID=UPI0012F80E8A|nr:NIF family HAD-type phosphatase [Hyalangium minutum]